MTNRGRRARLEDIQRIADALREPVEAPDLASSILARVDSQRCFLNDQGRALLWAGRAVAAFVVVLVVAGFVLINRAAPQALQVAAQPAPVSEVINVVSTQASQQIIALRGSFEPDRAQSAPLTAILSSVAPANELAEPITAALHAVRFVGPPEASSAEDRRAAAAEFRGVADLRLPRVSRFAQSAWPAVSLRETIDDRHLYEDESPLLSGTASFAPVVPK